MRSVRWMLPAMWILGLGCASASGGAAPPGVTAAALTAGNVAPAARLAVQSAGAITPAPVEGGRPAQPVSLAADGTASLGAEVLGRFEGNRFVARDGIELLHVEADGTVVLPWRAPEQTLSLRLSAEGLAMEVDGRANLLTLTDDGTYRANGNPAGGRFVPHLAAQRDAELVAMVLPMLSLMRGFAASTAPQRAAPTAAPAAPAR